MSGCVNQRQALSAQVMEITPEIAARWLAQGGRNRSIKKTHVAWLARQMAEGRWRLTGEAIKLDSDGAVRDGQNRLHAVIRSNTTIRSLVVRGVEDEAFDVMDSGVARGAADVLSIHGHSQNRTKAAVARLLIVWEKVGLPYDNNPEFRPNSQEIVEYVASHPEIEEAALRSDRIRHGGVPGGSMWGAVLARAAAIETVSSHDLSAFEQMTVTGANLTPDHPVLKLRSRLLNERSSKAKLPKLEVGALIVKAWNGWRAGPPYPGVLRWSRGGANPEPFPEPS